MSTSPIDGYGEIAAELTPLAVSQYLAANSWELERRDDDKEIWRRTDTGRRVSARLMLPMDTGYVDFLERFKELLHALGRIHDWDAGQLHDSIAATRADLLFVRVDQAMVDASIPFRQAIRSLDALYKMLEATAIQVADADKAGMDERSASVSGYLDDDLRLGHTKRGSFIFTVMSRLGDGIDAGSAPETSFSRRVMETLAIGLGAVRDAARQQDEAVVLNAWGESTLSADLVCSLEELTRPSYLRQIDLSFGWAAAGPPAKSGRHRIILDRPLMRTLPAVRRRLEQAPVAPPRRMALIGTVRSLMRSQEPVVAEVGTLELTTAIEGKQQIVRVPFFGDHRELVIDAYQRNFKLLVVGDLVVGARILRLTGNIRIVAEDGDYETGE
ncbi:hypothetical protein [Saccharopolyspora shandongensis]|uniref:hypothetical protein n=1 Tax=Saccharopolyspora shandongensis TaxID=418495 RepID=UPI0033D20CF1